MNAVVKMWVAILSLFLLGSAQGSPLFLDAIASIPGPRLVFGLMSDMIQKFRSIVEKTANLIIPGGGGDNEQLEGEDKSGESEKLRNENDQKNNDRGDSSDNDNKKDNDAKPQENDAKSQGSGDDKQSGRRKMKREYDEGLAAALLDTRRSMERYVRNVADSSLWENPCDYAGDPGADDYTPSMAEKLTGLIQSTYNSALAHKDKIAKVHSYSSFDQLLPVWTEYDWLRTFPGFTEDVLPRAKTLYQPMPDDFMSGLMDRIDQVLPSMYKSLKIVVAGLNTMSTKALQDEQVVGYEDLKPDIEATMQGVRAVLCSFNDLIRARKLPIEPLPDAPEVQPDQTTFILLVYRDTLNYLEYLKQVFQEMSQADR